MTFLELAHMVGATQHHVSCTGTHGRCYATSCFLHLHTWSVLRNIMFLALAHMVGATQHHVSCTCTHGRCYATSCFLHLHTWSVLRNIMFLALAHMVGATQHHVSCTCTHGRCYADATVHPERPKMVKQWMWRTQLGPATAEAFLQGLKDAVRQL